MRSWYSHQCAADIMITKMLVTMHANVIRCGLTSKPSTQMSRAAHGIVVATATASKTRAVRSALARFEDAIAIVTAEA
jgi:predicted Fe-Mo cluster-binding NifX family protein